MRHSITVVMSILLISGCPVDGQIQQGEQGPPGEDGLSCWDLDGDGHKDLPAEDTNGDGIVDVLDCRGDLDCAACDKDFVNEGQAGAITASMIADAAVTIAKLAQAGARTGQVLKWSGTSWAPSEDKTGESSGCDGCDSRFVNEAQSGSVTTSMIVDGAVGASELASGAVTLKKIDATGAASGKVLKTNGVTMYWGADETGSGGSGGITAVLPDSGLIGGGSSGVVTLGIQTGGVTAAHLAPDSVRGSEIAAGAVGSDEIALGAVRSSAVADNSLAANDLGEDCVGLSELNASDGASGRYLKHTGSGMQWTNVDGSSQWSDGSGGIYSIGRVAIGTSATTYDQQLRIESDREFAMYVSNTSSANEVTAVMGSANNSWQGIGVWGAAGGEAVTGVYGLATGSSASWGIWGKENSSSSSAMAGWFTGNVHVNGTLTASDKQFKIDHPLDPENKYLRHGCVESDEMINVYSGNVILDADGSAAVTLPDWFDVLNRDCRYQLTCRGSIKPCGN